MVSAVEYAIKLRFCSHDAIGWLIGESLVWSKKMMMKKKKKKKYILTLAASIALQFTTPNMRLFNGYLKCVLSFFCVFWSLHTTFWSRSVPVGDCLYCDSIEFWIPIPFCISMCGVLPSPFLPLFILKKVPHCLWSLPLCRGVMFCKTHILFNFILSILKSNPFHSQSLCFVSFSIWFNIHSVVLNPNLPMQYTV